LQTASEKSRAGTLAMVMIRPRKSGAGLTYTVPMAVMPKLFEINKAIQDPLQRYSAVMAIPDIFTVEPLI
jgi:hypothetical protein